MLIHTQLQCVKIFLPQKQADLYTFFDVTRNCSDLQMLCHISCNEMVVLLQKKISSVKDKLLINIILFLFFIFDMKIELKFCFSYLYVS